MTNFKHLTQNQILAYANESLSEPESNEIGRHLIQCPICRQSLPVPSIEQFRAAMMTERETSETPAAGKAGSSLPSIFSSVPAFFTYPGNLLSSGALIVILSFSALVWFGAGNSDREISGSFAADGSEIIINQDSPFAPPNAEIARESPNPDINPNAAFSAPKLRRTVSPKQNSSSTARRNSIPVSVKKLPADKNISSTRGASPKCEDGQSFESRALTDGRQIVLNWEKVASAAKYHLYISDQDEILVDEFETAEATSYVVEKTLDAGKIYQWKIIVVLKNGKTVVGDSQKFTVKNLQSTQKKTGKRKIPAVRCSMNSLIEN